MRLLPGVVIGALAAEGWAAPPVLERIEVLGHPASAVRLDLSHAVPRTVARSLAATPEAPTRIYLDLPGVTVGSKAPAVVPGSGYLLRTRSAQFEPGTTRVVLDLAHAVPFAVHTDDRTIVIELGSRPLAPPRGRPLERLAADGDPLPPEASAAPSDRAPGSPPRPLASAHPEGGPLPGSRPAPEVLPPPPDPQGSGLATHAAPSLPVVVVDAGHGGRDPGAEGVGGVLEKDVVLEVARRLASRLPTRLPVSVLMTRTDDSFMPIERRLASAPEGTLLFLSLHANACSDPAARGLEVFYGGGAIRAVGGGGASPQAALLGRCLAAALHARVGFVRGPARPGDFGVLVRNPAPSALVEIGYLTHPGEAAQTQEAVYQDLLVEALADGVVEFLQTSAAPSS
jgi:N-acetylmuramoyl-L-alanine amidase